MRDCILDGELVVDKVPLQGEVHLLFSVPPSRI